ncbi:MAG: hypothetical protein GHCLOJNM_03847 [bacterium]|nr:hypothetical protein [bacterium]
MSSFHGEILSTAQARVLQRLGSTLGAKRFYLGGGTAIALHLAHRESHDFDWFTESELADPLSLASELRASGCALEALETSRGTLHGHAEQVKMSFIEYRYPLLAPLDPWPEMGCLVASLDDLACMKLAAIAQRGYKRDFIDLHALGLKHCSLEVMLEHYERKYRADPNALLYALSYFGDADPQPSPKLLWKVDWEEIKNTVRGWVKQVS